MSTGMKMRRVIPSYEKIVEYFQIVDGQFVWKINRNSIVKAGMQAGSMKKHGRTSVLIIDNVVYSSASVAYSYWYGIPPTKRVTFVNGVRTDFRKENIQLEGIHREVRV